MARKRPPARPRPAEVEVPPAAPGQEVIRPNPKQVDFLSSKADIVVYGGAAGGGKTYALLLEPLRHREVADFAALIFRRTNPEIILPMGLWDESGKLYPQFNADPMISEHKWTFPSGARVRFAHMEHDKDRFEYSGAQIPLIGFDQLELFTESQFWFMFSRNRSTCGVPPYVRATCNPVTADDKVGGWLHKLLQWWIDPKTGLAIEARSGVLRWVARRGDALEWADTKEEMLRRFPEMRKPGREPRSVTFIPAKLEDNEPLTDKDPGYAARIDLLPRIERERLKGNWNVKPTAGKVFNRDWFEVVGAAPAAARRCRYWDKAATAGSGDYSAGVKFAVDRDGVYYVEHVVRGQWSALARNRTVKQTAEVDGKATHVRFEQEGGSGGKESAEISVRDLAGWNVGAAVVTGDKVTRAEPLSSQAEARNVKLVRGPWNEPFLDEMHAFDGSDGGVDDQVDGATGAFNYLAKGGGGFDPFSWSSTKSASPKDTGERYRDPRVQEEPFVVGYSDRGDMRRQPLRPALRG